MRVGVGMISRGEVGLIVAGVGVSSGVLTNDIYTTVIIMIALTTIIKKQPQIVSDSICKNICVRKHNSSWLIGTLAPARLSIVITRKMAGSRTRRFNDIIHDKLKHLV